MRTDLFCQPDFENNAEKTEREGGPRQDGGVFDEKNFFHACYPEKKINPEKGFASFYETEKKIMCFLRVAL